MELSTYPNGEGYVVVVTGNLTAEQPLARLPQMVDRILREKAPSLVKVRVREVDLTDLEGVAALARAWRLTVASGARFQLLDGQPRVRHRLRETGLLGLLEEGRPPA